MTNDQAPMTQVGISHDLVEQRLAVRESGEVLEEVLDEGAGFVGVAAGDVGGDEAGGFGAERVIVGEGFGVGDVEPGGPETLGVKGVAQGGLIDGRTAADVVEDGAGFDLREAGGVEEVARF